MSSESGSKPESQARHALKIARGAACSSSEVGGLREGLIPRNADLGRELAGDLVAEAKAEIDVVEASTHTELRDRLNGDVRLEARMRDEALRDVQVVGGA